MTGAPLLRVTGLRKEFRHDRSRLTERRCATVAVDGIDLSVDRGATLGLVGESGCGKSTTALLIARLLAPTAGRIEFEGRDITGLRTRALRPVRNRLQIVFQDATASLNPRRTVGAAIGTGPTLRGVGRREVAALVAPLMDQVGLEPALMNRYPHELSGGQRARVGLARALAVQPSLLICDEPVAAVDVSVRAQLINLFADLRDSLGLGYLFISHDLAVVRHLADEVAVMFGGVVVERAGRETIFAGSLHPYTHQLLDAVPVPVPPGAPVAEGGSSARAAGIAADTPTGGCRFRGRCPLAQQVCEQVEPPLVELRPGHSIACHFPAERESTH